MGYVGCDRTLAVATLFAVVACADVSFTAIVVNKLDLAPLHAGRIDALVSSVGMISAIAAPMTVGALTYERSTRDEWQEVFFLAAGVYVVGAVVFLAFGSGERQSWAD